MAGMYDLTVRVVAQLRGDGVVAERSVHEFVVRRRSNGTVPSSDDAYQIMEALKRFNHANSLRYDAPERTFHLVIPELTESVIVAVRQAVEAALH